MAETRRKSDQDFREGAVRLVRETGRPIAQVARDLGINEGTFGNWVNADKRRRGDGNGALGEDERAELAPAAQGMCRPDGPSVAVRGKPTVTPTAGPARPPSAMPPSTPRRIDSR
jgi:transposase-like protein